MQIARTRGRLSSCVSGISTRIKSIVFCQNPDHSQHNLQVGDGFVTLMALGVPTIFKVIRYTDEQDGLAKVASALDLLAQT